MFGSAAPVVTRPAASTKTGAEALAKQRSKIFPSTVELTAVATIAQDVIGAVTAGIDRAEAVGEEGTETAMHLRRILANSCLQQNMAFRQKQVEQCVASHHHHLDTWLESTARFNARLVRLKESFVQEALDLLAEVAHYADPELKLASEQLRGELGQPRSQQLDTALTAMPDGKVPKLAH